eukprot:TRINITY_DN16481_c0_g1_i2.p1 TRINITY_DN16481_c0_g1~~TRINITY_DN16481_c0_g1_i2.p1  ORF type:complete len:154 (+),score=27.65 TRINITY_DN16481_c0_g1_i2:62-463(+)
MSDSTTVIILGNSGAGKSFLGNVMLGEDRFVHAYDAASVTKATEKYEKRIMMNGVMKNICVFNIPGLMESARESIDRNKAEIQKAFSQCATSIVAYVFDCTGGRLRQEDLDSYTALNRAYVSEEKRISSGQIL